MSIQTCELPRPSVLSALWSRLTGQRPGKTRIAGLPSRLWPDGAMPQHPCASRIARELARDLSEAPEHLRRDIGLDGGARMKRARLPYWPMW